MRRSSHGAAAVFVLPLLAVLLLVAPAFSQQVLHENPVVGEDGNVCAQCHYFSSTGGVEANTESIRIGVRTMTDMKSAAGATPDKFGCTFCHNNAANSKMKGVMEHFTLTAFGSRHPIGETYNGWTGARTNTKNEFLSNADGTTGGAAELDCVDCHDINLLDYDGVGTGTYTVHVLEGTGARVANPKMLKNVTLAGEYDNFCRGCHSAANGTNYGGTTYDINVTSHAESGVIEESDGTDLKTGPNANARCTFCHSGHASSNKKLFKESIDLSIGTKCTDCHQDGDAEVAGVGNFTRHGHAKTGIAMNCNSCHDVTDGHDPVTPANGPKMLFRAPDTNVSMYGKSLLSVCSTCHGDKPVHTGPLNSQIGCIDCHDEHAEGSGPGSNTFMIPQNLPNNYGTTELSMFESAGPTNYDYYRGDGTGLCDNTVCHGSVVVEGTPLSPLSTFMASGKHSWGNQPANSDCKSCHSHSDPGGTFRAEGRCDDCHGQPPVSTATSVSDYLFAPSNANESKTPHALHAGAADNQYKLACTYCHVKGSNPETHDTAPDTYESVFFDTSRNPSASAPAGAPPYTTPDYDETTSTCSNLYCHSDGQSSTSVGSVQWMTDASNPDWSVQSLGCEGCHGKVAVNAPGTMSYGAPDYATSNSHAKHSSYPCAACHNTTVQDTDPAGGWDLLLPLKSSPHVNGSADVASGAGYTFAYAGAGQCNTISCHGNNGATWGGASLSCDMCHFRTNANGGDLNNFNLSDGTASLLSSEEWTSTGHGRTTAFPGSLNTAANFSSTSPTDLKGCLYCHDGAVTHGTATNPFRLRNKNALGQGLTAANAYGWNDTCLICHAAVASFPAAVGVDPDGASGAYTIRNSTANDVNQNHYGSKHGADASTGGTFCWDCHDPHGDTIQFMFQGPNGSSPGNGVTQTSAGSAPDLYYGVPVTSRTVTGFDAATGGGTPANWNSSDYANAAFTGICQTCHTATSWYNQSTFTPLASHNGADTQRCTSCHQHTDDFASGCDTCHGNPPPPRPTSGTTQTWVSDNAAGTQGEHVAHATTYAISDCNNTCHVSTNHTTNKTSANMGVRAATVAASTGVHKYGTIDNQDVWTGNTAGITSVVDDSCVNVSCHNSTYSSNTYRSAANPGYVRYWNNSYDCYSCHAYDGQADSAIRPGTQTSVSADWIASGSHDQHINRNGYALACTNCHANNVGNNAHKNGSVNFATNFGQTRAGAIATGGVYDTNGATGGWTQATNVVPASPAHAYYCGNVYCHSSGEPRGAEAITYPTTTQWTVAASGNCGTCHTVTGSVLATNVHEKHTGNTAGQYSYTCQTCHYTVVDATPAIIAGGYALHVNGTNNVAFATNAGTYALAGGTCTATYCHSKGLDFSAPYTGTATAAAVVADWDIAAGGLGCFGCHGDGISIAYPTYLDETTIRPNATDFAKQNSHAKHSAFGCQVCHSGTTTTGNTITTVANHGNGSWQVSQPASGYTFGVSGGTLTDVAYTPVSCSTISCHGNGNATWGQTLTCNACHDTNGAAVAENGGVLGGAANSTANEVDNAQWLNTGHGLASGQYDADAINGGGGNPAANLGCYTSDPNGGCHVSSAAHVPTTAADPFRLGATYQDNPSGICTASCHSTVGTNHHNDDVIANAATAYNFETKCIDCHDPHGDSNMFMVHNMVAADGADADNPKAMSSSKGIPDTTKAVTFIADTAGTDFADTASPWVFTGICEVCHTATRWYQGQSGGGMFPGPQAGHTYTTNCGSCHQHSGGFKGSGCDGCHGNAAGQNWPDGSGGSPAYVDNDAGAHLAHINAIAGARGWTTDAQKNGTCVWCHANPGSPRQGTYTGSPEAGHDTDSLADSTVDVIGDGRVTAGDATFLNNANPAVADANGTYNRTTKKCSNIDCHGGVETPSWGADAAGPTWASGDGLTVTDLKQSSYVLSIDWNAATDSTGPVTYDLRRNTVSFGGTCTGGTLVGSALGNTSYQDTVGNGTTYYYCVVAKDAVTPTPNTTYSTTNASGTASLPSGGTCSPGTPQTLYANMANGSFGIDGTQAPATLNTNVNYDGVGGRRPMQIGTTGLTASNMRWTAFPSTGTFYRTARFYLPQGDICVGPDITSGTSVMRSSSTADLYQFRLVDYDPNGASYNGNTIVTSPNVTAVTTTSGKAFTMTFSQYKVPANHYLVLEVWNSVSATTNAPRIYGGGTAATTGTYFTTPIFQTTSDTTPPAFTGIGTAADQAIGGTVKLTWSATNDTATGGSNPVVYRIWWNPSASNGNPAQGTHDATTTLANFTVSGLTNGTPYYFLVRAEDAAGNIETNVVERTATPTGGGGGGGVTCTSCHGTAPSTPAHSKHANNDSNYTDCDKCHGNGANSVSANYTTSGPAGLHNNGSVDMYFLRIAGETNAAFNNVAAPNDTCSNVNCHMNALTPSWSTGSGNCAMCHGYPPSGAGGSTNHLLANRAGSYASTDAEFYAAHGTCDTCHGISGNSVPPTVATAMGTPVDNTGAGGDAYDPATHHANGSVTMNGTATPGDGLSAEYLEATNNCNKSCHTTAEKFTAVQANTVQRLRLGGGDCTNCHKVGGTGSIVTDASPHSSTVTGLTCAGCHTAHGAGTVVIPNYANVGINYTANGETGISLGGSATTGSTEAEICWNCHAAQSGVATLLDATDPSEWGTNTQTNGLAAARNYNFGTLTGTNSWFTGTWTSANFSYKTGKLIDKPRTSGVTASGGSTHAANPLAGITVRGVDQVAQVRCSYCHDVHDTKAGSPNGKPYLRGTWKGNPYLEDGAPRSGITFASGTFGAVPRGTTTATGSGGYQIDQNNGSPAQANGWTLANYAGLCALCHGSTAPADLTATSVNTLDQFAAASQWVGTNGHAAAVLGGGNTGAFNLLTESTRRHPATGYATAASATDSAFRSAPWMAYRQLSTGTQGYGMRGNDGYALAPTMSRPYAHQSYQWGATIDNGAGAIQTDYHQFPCSKCHTPHASRLPALMITNCLDTKVNTWDDSQGLPSGVSAENTGVRASNWTSAQNCHRRRDPAFGKNWTGSPGTLPTQTDGWNNVTPW